MIDQADPRFRAGRRGVVLIDAWEDEIVEDTAWVEVFDSRSRFTCTAGVQDARSAVATIERMFPLEDRPEEERYVCDGEQVWLKPDVENAEYSGGEWPVVCPWVPAEDGHDGGALKFWVVRVVCPI